MSLSGGANVRYEKEVTIDDIVNEANAIYRKCKKLWPTGADADNLDLLSKVHQDMRSEHPQFASAYPIVLRYMCELKEYRQRALKKYLNHLKHHPWTTEDKFLESQAMYVTLLYKETHPRYDEQKARNLFDNTVRLLKLEREAFKQQVESNKKDVEREHRRMMTKNTLELKEWFAKHGKDAVDVPVCAVLLDADGTAIATPAAAVDLDAALAASAADAAADAAADDFTF